MQPQIDTFPGTTGTISIAYHLGHPFQLWLLSKVLVYPGYRLTGQEATGDIRSPLGIFFSILKL